MKKMDKSNAALEKIAHGTVLVFAGILISKILGYAYRLITARFGASEYGLLSVGLALFNVLSITAMLGLNQGVLRYVSFYRTKKDEERVKGVIFSSLFFSALASIFLGILTYLFADKIAILYFHEPRLGVVFKILAIAIPFDVLKNVLFNGVRAFENVTYEIYTRNGFETLAKVVFTLVFLLIGWKLLGATLAFTFSLIASFVLAVYYSKKVFSFKKEIKPRFLNKELLNYSIPLVVNNLTILVLLWADTLLIGHFRTAQEVGIYNAAGPTAALMYLFPQAILALFLPVLTGLYAQENKDEFRRAYLITTKWISIANVALFGAFILMSKEILVLFFGKEYASGSLALIILSSGYLVYYLALVSNNILLIYERTKTILVSSAIGSILNIVLNIILTPRYGIVGAAISTSISYIIVSVILFVITNRLTKVNIFDKYFWKIFLAGVLSLGVSYILNSYLSILGIKKLIVLSVTFSFIYGLLLLLLRVVQEADLIMIREVGKRTKINTLKIERFLEKYQSDKI